MGQRIAERCVHSVPPKKDDRAPKGDAVDWQLRGGVGTKGAAIGPWHAPNTRTTLRERSAKFGERSADYKLLSYSNAQTNKNVHEQWHQ